MNDKLINYIKEHKIDTDSLAIRTGIPKIRLNEILNNVRKPTSKELGRIASKLVVTLDMISEDEDIINASYDNKLLLKTEKKTYKFAKRSLIIGIIIVVLILIAFLTITFNKTVRIECTDGDKHFREDIQYNIVLRDIRLSKIKYDDGNEYNKMFYDIHYNQVKKEYNGNCTVEKTKGIKLWNLD